MKKLTSILLVLAIISSCFVFVGCSAEEKLGYFKERRIKRDYIEYFNIQDKSADDVVLDYYGGNYNGCEIVMPDAECHDPEKWSENISGSKVNYHDSNRLYAWHDGEFMTLSEAYSSEVLSDGDIAQIASKFNSEVTHFRDTGDEFDYTDGKSLSKNPLRLIVSGKRLLVMMNHKASIDGDIPSPSFFGPYVVSVEKNGIQKHGEESFLMLHLTLCIDSRIFAKYVASQIEKIPGVRRVVCERSALLSTTNDPKYTDGTQWGIQSTGIDKVWDFTTGSSNIRVGIIDTGIASHEDLDGNYSTNDAFDFRDTLWTDPTYYSKGDSNYHGTHVAGIIGKN